MHRFSQTAQDDESYARREAKADEQRQCVLLEEKGKP